MRGVSSSSITNLVGFQWHYFCVLELLDRSWTCTKAKQRNKWGKFEWCQSERRTAYRPTWRFSTPCLFPTKQKRVAAKRSASSAGPPRGLPTRRLRLHVTSATARRRGTTAPARLRLAASDGGGASGARLPRFGIRNQPSAQLSCFPSILLCFPPNTEAPFLLTSFLGLVCSSACGSRLVDWPLLGLCAVLAVIAVLRRLICAV